MVTCSHCLTGHSLFPGASSLQSPAGSGEKGLVAPGDSFFAGKECYPGGYESEGVGDSLVLLLLFLVVSSREVYCLTDLPFGLNTAPRVFTRVATAAAALSRQKGICNHAYLDD